MAYVTEAQLAATNGASLVGFEQGGGANAETVETALRRVLSLESFAVGDGVADDTSAVVDAIARAAATGQVLDGNGGRFRLTGTIYLPTLTPLKLRNATFLIDHAGPAVSAHSASGNEVARCTFDMVNLRAMRDCAVAWECAYWQYCQWINCLVGTAGGTAKFGTAWQLRSVCYWNTFYSPEVERCDRGWDLDDANDTRFFMPRMVDFSGTPEAAVVFSGPVSGTCWYGISFEAAFSAAPIQFDANCTQNYFYGGRVERRGATGPRAIAFNGAVANGIVGMAPVNWNDFSDTIGNNFVQFYGQLPGAILNAGAGQFFVSSNTVNADTPGGQIYNTVRNRFTGYLSAFGARDFAMTPAVSALDMNGEAIDNVGTLILSAAATSPGSGKVAFGNGTGSAVGAAGGADALPARPLGYLTAYVGATAVKIPYYNAS
jgi:hypothetical protein